MSDTKNSKTKPSEQPLTYTGEDFFRDLSQDFEKAGLPSPIMHTPTTKPGPIQEYEIRFFKGRQK